VSIPSASFQRVLRNCEKRGSHVQICAATAPNNEADNSAAKHYIIFATEGDDASLTFHMRFHGNENTSADLTCMKTEVYSLKHLILLTKATHLSTYVTLYLAHDFVLGVKYNIGTIGYVTFCVVPQCDKSETLPPTTPHCADAPPPERKSVEPITDPEPEPATVTANRTETESLDRCPSASGSELACSGKNLRYDIFTKAKQARSRKRKKPQARRRKKKDSTDHTPGECTSAMEFRPSVDLVMPSPPGAL
jgi:hypothetical protein